MNATQQSLWSQFGASIDMLDRAIAAWPYQGWEQDRRFFYTAYHTLIYLEYYLTDSPVGFQAQLPFTLVANDQIPADALDDVVPDRIYAKAELLAYVACCRSRCRAVIGSLTEERMHDRWIETEGGVEIRNFGRLELLLYNMRHVQHHAAQLNTLLRSHTGDAPRWVSRAREDAG